jgi:hypothetical protein
MQGQPRRQQEYPDRQFQARHAGVVDRIEPLIGQPEPAVNADQPNAARIVSNSMGVLLHASRELQGRRDLRTKRFSIR